MTTSLIELFIRDLNKLNDEILAYPDEYSLWEVDAMIKNSGGNLAIHIIGNLNHFIGAHLGSTNYIRQRDKEFNDKNVPRELIIDHIKDIKNILNEVLSSLNKEVLSRNYPIEVFGKPMSTEYFLIHLYGHLNYHLGQINYHRRLLS
ncbi:MAG: DUF1572 family protein [Aureibaculum sp.]|nr:DUF1572 family protein [Aureibaculum sp.]